MRKASSEALAQSEAISHQPAQDRLPSSRELSMLSTVIVELDDCHAPLAVQGYVPPTLLGDQVQEAVIQPKEVWKCTE